MKADEFHKKAQQLLDWLADAERQLRYKGSIPDEELLILQQMEEHKVGGSSARLHMSMCLHASVQRLSHHPATHSLYYQFVALSMFCLLSSCDWNVTFPTFLFLLLS